MLDAPLDARWTRLPGLVRHTFTHFPLELTVFLGRVPTGTPAPDEMRWTACDALGEEALPNVETGYQENVPENPADSSETPSNTLPKP